MIQIGSTFENKYEISEILGSGGFGTVFKANQLDYERTVAIKLMHAHYSVNQDFCARFLREARSLCQVNHKNVVTVFNLGLSQDNELYLVMEYIEGKSLQTILRENGPLELGFAVQIFLSLADAISVMHKQRIVHRDIKPANIVLSESPEKDTPKLVDFGLVHMDESTNQKLTSTGAFVGSPHYMSPEQCKGLLASERSDIYSLTVSFYELITGRFPFDADTVAGLMYLHINEKIPAVERKVCNGHEAQVRKLIEKGMAKSPAERFSSMNELSEAFKELAADLASEKRKFGTGMDGRNKIAIYLSVLVSISIVLFSIAFPIQRSSLSSVKHLAKLPTLEFNFRSLQSATAVSDSLEQVIMLKGISEHAKTRKLKRASLPLYLSLANKYAEALSSCGMPARALEVITAFEREIKESGLEEQVYELPEPMEIIGPLRLTQLQCLWEIGRRKESSAIWKGMPLSKLELGRKLFIGLPPLFVMDIEVKEIEELMKGCEWPLTLCWMAKKSIAVGHEDIAEKFLQKAESLEAFPNDVLGRVSWHSLKCFLALDGAGAKQDLASAQALQAFQTLKEARGMSLKLDPNNLSFLMAALTLTGHSQKAVEILKQEFPDPRPRLNKENLVEMVKQNSDNAFPAIAWVINSKTLPPVEKNRLLMDLRLKCPLERNLGELLEINMYQLARTTSELSPAAYISSCAYGGKVLSNLQFTRLSIEAYRKALKAALKASPKEVFQSNSGGIDTTRSELLLQLCFIGEKEKARELLKEIPVNPGFDPGCIYEVVRMALELGERPRVSLWIPSWMDNDDEFFNCTNACRCCCLNQELENIKAVLKEEQVDSSSSRSLLLDLTCACDLLEFNPGIRGAELARPYLNAILQKRAQIKWKAEDKRVLRAAALVLSEGGFSEEAQEFYALYKQFYSKVK